MFNLDKRLQCDTIQLASLPLCELLLMNNSHYPWLILVPRRKGITEIYQLEQLDRDQLWRESHQLSIWMGDYFHFDKLNIGALGNVVSQLHLHHVGRRQGDPVWPAPVWGSEQVRLYSAVEADQIKKRVTLDFSPNGLMFYDSLCADQLIQERPD